MLKKNGLTPVDIQQALEVTAGAKTPVKRHRSSEEILKDLSPEQVKLIYRNNDNHKTEKKMTSQSKKIAQNRGKGKKIKTKRYNNIYSKLFYYLKKLTLIIYMH